MAVDQSRGRGQKGTVWQSEPGKNLTFSLLLTPAFLNPKQQFVFTAAISLAVAQWLETLIHADVFIKWPNDIYVGDRKIGGILIENILKGKTWKSSIVGIGLNINQTVFPTGIGERATSVKQILHRDCQLSALLPDLCNHIEREYLELKAGRFEPVLDNYTRRLYRINELHPYLIDGIKVPGILRGVTETGRLQMDFNGHLVDFDIKEIAFVF